ncbi:hypothetical protein ACFQ9R_24765 [Nocardia sp. NPDC056541]|uniref:hypothetical protein n=1 Tax=Nocardia sp. NPDC056541 TaxID=3345860 RepID=UPI00366BAFB3
MNYVLELEQIFDEHARRTAILHQELDAINRATADRDRDHAERTAAGLERVLAQAEEDEKVRAAAEQRQAELNRLEAEAQEQRAAIARAAAARRANDVVAPYDDDDPEAEYYQRKSWLV